MTRALILSIKPEFASKIFNGLKTVELRKSTPKVRKGDLIVIYSTNPVKAIIGICRVSAIIKLTPEKMWKLHKKKLGIDKKRFNAYYENYKTAVGIKLTSIYLLNTEIKLHVIKKAIPDFQPPQTFKYFSKPHIFKTYLKHAS